MLGVVSSSRDKTPAGCRARGNGARHLLSPSGYTLVSNDGEDHMFDEQQESATDDRGDEVPAPPGERSSTEPVPATKGPDAGEGESSHSGEEQDAVQD